MGAEKEATCWVILRASASKSRSGEISRGRSIPSRVALRRSIRLMEDFSSALRTTTVPSGGGSLSRVKFQVITVPSVSMTTSGSRLKLTSGSRPWAYSTALALSGVVPVTLCARETMVSPSSK